MRNLALRFHRAATEFIAAKHVPRLGEGFSSGAVARRSKRAIGEGMRRILIIDDEADIREVASLSLELVAGWQVTTAGSGAEGLAAAPRERPDAILLDVMMPGMDGPRTFEMLRGSKELSGIPVVFLTAKVQAMEQRGLTAIGAAGILAKPFNPLTLAEDLSRILGWDSPSPTQPQEQC